MKWEKKLDQKDNIIQNLRTYMEGMHKVQNYYDLLNNIFDMHFKYDDKSELIRNLQVHLMEVYPVNAMALFEYLIFDRFLAIEELDLSIPVYKKTLECINNIKSKYGFFIRKELQSSRIPFLINSVETNISKNDSIHHVKFSRSDGESLIGLFKPDSLIPIVNALLNALSTSITQGIFNINKEAIELTYKEMDHLHGVLKEIEETYQENE